MEVVVACFKIWLAPRFVSLAPAFLTWGFSVSQLKCRYNALNKPQPFYNISNISFTVILPFYAM